MKQKSQHTEFNRKCLIFGKGSGTVTYKLHKPTQLLIMKITQKAVQMNNEDKLLWIDTGALKC